MSDCPITHAQLRAYVESLGGPRRFAARHGLVHRTAERLYSGAKPLPSSLAAEIGAALAEAGQ